MTTVEQHLRDDAPKVASPQHSRPATAERETSPLAGDDVPAWRDADERLRLAVDAGSIGTWDFSPITGELAWSDRCKSLFGFTSDVTPTLEMFLAHVHADDRAHVDQRVAAAFDPLGDGSYEAEFRIERADGRMAWIVCKGRALFAGSGNAKHAIRLIGTAVDITDRRRAEDYARLLAEASSLLASSLDLEVMLAGIGKLACQRFADVVVIDLEDETGTLARAAAVEREPRRTHLFERVRSVATDQSTWTDEHPIARALREQQTIRLETVSASDRDAMARTDEHRILLHDIGLSAVIAAPLVARGRTLGAISFLRTTTRPGYDAAEQLIGEELARRTATAIENAQLYRAAVAASEAKSSFLAAMSHELRTPLTAIIGYEELLADGITGPVTDPQRHQLGRIKASATHLLALIDEILTYSRVEAGSEQPRFESLCVKTALEEAAAIVEPLVTDRGLSLEVVLDPGLKDAHLLSDPQKVRQILVNLLSNATKFTLQGKIEIGARREGRQLLCDVRDTGIGIAEEHLHHIFEPFWQADARATRRIAGTGLGLTVSRRLAQMIGGELRVQSAPGRGSTFTLELPMDATSPQRASERRSA
ncbi:MAG: PAS domain-containing sensor histidine kinase [Gemmatimonadaceae bacterium]